MSSSSSADRLNQKATILENLVGALHDVALIAVDLNGVILHWNSGAELVFGYSSVLGKSWNDLNICPGISFEEIVANKKPNSRELSFQKENGQRFRARLSLFNSSDESGCQIGYSIMIKDVSELKNTAEQLRRREEDFVSMVAAVKDYAIIALDPMGTITTWNEGARSITGFEASEAIGKNFSIFYPVDDQAKQLPVQALRTATEAGRFFEEGWRVRKNGTSFWADDTITCVKDESNNLRGFLKVTRDLSERRHAEELLRRSNEVFTLTVAAVKEYAIFLLDPNGKILTWNAGAERFKGYVASEIIGKHFSIFYPEELRKIDHPSEELRLAKLNGHYEEEGWRLRKDGSTFLARVTITSVCDEHGEHRGFVKVTQDLTKQKMSEEDIRQARDEAIRSSELKSQFVANVSHEIRTPMAGIIGMAELLHTDPELNDEQRELAEHLLDSGKRLLIVLNDILDFSKLEAGRVNLDVTEFSPRLLANEVCQSFISLSRGKDLEMVLDIDEGIPEKLFGDEVKIRQVLSNLVGNAVKFTNAGSIQLSVRSAEIGALSDDNVFNGNTVPVLFEVHDTGIGITPEQKEKLFQPFIQADGSTRRRFGGTGLGLSISKGYVQLMHGTIDVESEQGKGSVFRVVVPLQKQVAN